MIRAVRYLSHCQSFVQIVTSTYWTAKSTDVLEPGPLPDVTENESALPPDVMDATAVPDVVEIPDPDTLVI